MIMTVEDSGLGSCVVLTQTKGSVAAGTPSSPRMPDITADRKAVLTSPPSPRLSPPPLTCSSASTSTPPEVNSSYPSREGWRSSSEEGCGGRGASKCQENPLRLRELAKRSSPGTKGQRMCAYELCPSPLHSKKWRVVTAGTTAGGRDWNSLVGQTLCDSCYSTFRKHGTFVRSIRTTEGWSRIGLGAAGAVGKEGVGEKGDKPEKPKKSQQQKQQLAPNQRMQRLPKRPLPREQVGDEGWSMNKRQDRKAAIKSGWWRRDGGADDVERELLEAVAILRSLHSSRPCAEGTLPPPEPLAPAVDVDVEPRTQGEGEAGGRQGLRASAALCKALESFESGDAGGAMSMSAHEAGAAKASHLEVQGATPGARGHAETNEVDLGALDTVRGEPAERKLERAGDTRC